MCCVLGLQPLVQHDIASKANMAMMNDAYAAHKAAGAGAGSAGVEGKSEGAAKAKAAAGTSGKKRGAGVSGEGSTGSKGRVLKQTKLV